MTETKKAKSELPKICMDCGKHIPAGMYYRSVHKNREIVAFGALCYAGCRVEIKTRDDIEALKKDWSEDPLWEIEDTDGFEAHKEELLAFSEGKKAAWDTAYEEKEAKRVEKFAASCTKNGILKDLRDLESFDITGWEGEYSATKVSENNIKSRLLMIKALMHVSSQLERIANKLVIFQPNAKGG